jgi:hypothetical protein
MKTKKSDSEDILRLIDQLSSEAEHSDDESRAALAEAGIDADTFVATVRNRIQGIIPRRHERPDPWIVVRSCALAVAAASAVLFVVVFHLNYRAGVEAQRQLARAQLISPLLPGLASDDPDRRSLAIVVARQIDPGFASETEKQLVQWEISSQSEPRVASGRNSPYSGRIIAGLQKLQLSRDPDDRKFAIWNDLLPVLKEARKNRDEFVDVALEYKRVLPYLKLRNPEVFLDSYWGEIWILNILLQSNILPVVQAARDQAPEPAVLEQIFQKHAPGLPDKDRQAFEEAVSVYENIIKVIQ